MQAPAANRLRCLITLYYIAYAMAHSDLNEYCRVVRLESGQTAPSGFTLVSASAPAVLQQLCRTFTFARGLTLYELWDCWNQTATGYVVPSSMFSMAWEYRNGLLPALWSDLPLHHRNILNHARTALLEQFPRIAEIAAIRIAERAQREKWNGEKQKLEKGVVDQIRHEWTSYEVRLEQFERYNQPASNTTASQSRSETSLLRKKDEVFEIVKPRIRDVLISWLPKDVSAEYLASFFKRHELFDAADGKGGYREENMLVRTSNLRYHGGLETPANLLAKTELNM